MLIIKIFLVGSSLSFFLYFFVAARGRPIQKLGMGAVFLTVIVFALEPDLATRIARWVGIGRGADLALYLSTLTLLFLCFNLYLAQKKLEDQLRVVVRALGLLTARVPSVTAPPRAAESETDGEAAVPTDDE